MTAIIPGDIDDVQGALDLNYKLCSNAIHILDLIEEHSTTVYEKLYDMYNYELHRHNYHKHDSDEGHSYSDGFITKNNDGKAYLYTCRGHRTLVDLLLMEFKEAKDWDNNGLLFFYDFTFSYDDDELPPGIRKIMDNPCMPGYPKSHYINSDTIVPKFSSETLLWDNEYNVIPTGLDDNNNPTFVDRNNTVQIITWRDYLVTLPQQFYDQRKLLLDSEFQNIK